MAAHGAFFLQEETVQLHMPLLTNFTAALAFLALLPVSSTLGGMGSTSAVAQEAGATLGPPVTSFDLANGMKVVVIEDHRAPVVTHMVWYKVGAADEVSGKSGIAHLLEHLLFKGTEAAKPGEFSKVVASNGGSENAFTTSDYTAYHQRIARDRLGILMAYEADRMTGLKLTRADVETERQVVLEERASRTDSRPGALLSEQATAALYQNHPYGRPVIGWEHEIKALTLEDITAFYRRYYMPAKAILVVAGDVTPDEVRKLAQDTYGKVKNPAPLAQLDLIRNRPSEPPSVAPRRVEMTDPRAGSTRLTRTYLAPSFGTAVRGEGEGLELLAEILGGGSTARLYRELVVERALAVDAGAYFRGVRLDSGEFTIYAALAPGADLAALEAALDDTLRDIVKNGVTEAELTRAKTSVVSASIYAQDSQSHMARGFGSALTTGLTVKQTQAWPENVKAATAGDVVAAARAWLKLERSVTGTLRPGPGPGKEGGRS
ncbi:Peptidase, M16 family [hydrothermal vent metagenome]|uniref:Peptidase, M16 family n=1 Tax=hydrothermal vent metagenome TaxID=652676 RepID=A0A3B0U7F8_9ZZZZ